MAHNLPSGSLEPSEVNFGITHQRLQTGKSMGIELPDRINGDLMGIGVVSFYGRLKFKAVFFDFGMKGRS